jgi:hypothetical protein
LLIFKFWLLKLSMVELAIMGEWGVGSGEWGMGNGEWGMGNGDKNPATTKNLNY